MLRVRVRMLVLLASGAVPFSVGACRSSSGGGGMSDASASASSSAPPAIAAVATGTCSGRARLVTKTAEVDCYPYRCRDGRCLVGCETRQDCAGSDGPADLAENGWPLGCGEGRCYPLSPRHVPSHAPSARGARGRPLRSLGGPIPDKRRGLARRVVSAGRALDALG